MTLAEKICTCRRKQGMSQEALAAQLNVSRQAVSKWETGDAEPESGKLIALARTFGVTVDWLLTGGGDLDEDVQKDENAGKIQELSAFPVSAPKKFCQMFRNLRPGYFLYLGCFLLLLFLSLTVTHALLPLPDFSFDLYRLRYFFDPTTLIGMLAGCMLLLCGSGLLRPAGQAFRLMCLKKDYENRTAAQTRRSLRAIRTALAGCILGGTLRMVICAAHYWHNMYVLGPEKTTDILISVLLVVLESIVVACFVLLPIIFSLEEQSE